VLRSIRLALEVLPNNLVGAAALLVTLPVLGTAGYMAIEGWNFLDSLYMTVITITTIGYSEVRPLDDAGRVFSIFLAIGGVGAIFYSLISVFQFVLEGELTSILGVQRMKGRIQSLSDHYILCGFGRVGEEIAKEFEARGVPYVIVESNPEAIERANQRGYLLMVGDATHDAILKEAGIERARCLLAASDSDAGNTYIVLTAKALNPDIFAVARAAHPESEPRMMRAGANRVFSPYVVAARHMALSALQPILVGFADAVVEEEEGAGVLAEVGISEGDGLAGGTIDEVLKTCPTIVVLGVQRATGELTVGPPRQTRLSVGDKLILMGREEELESIHPARREQTAAS
jgi:voltage-gated potassium channel